MKNWFLLVVAVLLSVALLVVKMEPAKIAKTAPEPIKIEAPKDNVVPQFVILSFDGSRSKEMWEATRKFASEMRAKKQSVYFTYFISGVYFLTDAQRNLYQGPGQMRGASAIGFGGGADEVATRFEELRMAQVEGNEIASHLNGHFRGSNWSAAQWESEIDQFNRFLPGQKVVGLRTPLLSRNNYLYQILPKYGYKYDASAVGKMDEWPTKDLNGTWEIPLVTIPISGTRLSTISMDYNWFLAQTQGKDILRKGTPAWNKSYQQVVDSYMNYFDKNYQGKRAPVVIGHHFSTWNDGLYWEAMKTVAENVCGQPEVRCATFSQLVEYLDKH